MIDTRTYTANQLFDVVQANALPGNPAWANLQFAAAGACRDDFHGPGIYMVFFDSAPVYLGKFLGRKADVFSGDVRTTRWDKHLGTLTFRGRALSVRPRTLCDIRAHLGPRPGDAALLVDLGPAVEPILSRDRGCVSTLNRFHFAYENWSAFSGAIALERFDFLYVRVTHTADVARLRSAVSAAETRLIEQLRPRANSEVPRGLHLAGYTIERAASLIEQAIREEIDGDGAPAVPARLARGNARISHAREDEGKSAAEAFFDSIEKSEAARTLVGKLEALCDELDTEMFYTFTEGGDVRIWCAGSGMRQDGLNLLQCTGNPGSNSSSANAICLWTNAAP
jgi:hypothetical protein